MQALPNIGNDIEPREPIIPRERSTESSSTSKAALFFAVLIAIAASVGVAAWFTIVGKSELLSMVGLPVDRPVDHNAEAILELRDMLKMFATQLDGLAASIKKLEEDIIRQKETEQKLSTRVDDLAKFASGLEIKIEDEKREVQRKNAAVIKSSVAKIAETKIIPLTLVSIRYQGGLPCVSLRDGLESSSLLMPGDEWRGWEFVTADPAKRTANFRVQGKLQELFL